MSRTVTGIEKLLSSPATHYPFLQGKRIALLCNQASVLPDLTHSRIAIIHRNDLKLTALFTPQHGLFAEKQDNMKESDHELDHATGLPVFSLYSSSRKPTKEQLDYFDVMLVDLQDVGCRVYTYIWTMLLAMEECALSGKTMVILDRPNPIGGVALEGPLLEKDLYSFVGMAPIPLRHGMTMGELALMFKKTMNLDLELHIVWMDMWKREFYHPETGLPWVWPSPNLPTFETALVYPGQVILETVNISEGRGTTRPFEVFGAPFLQPERVSSMIKAAEGATLREQFFEPTFNKFTGERCRGFQLHVTDRHLFRPVRFTLEFLSVLWRLYPGELEWTSPPYEYEYEKLPADLVIGNREIRKMVEQGADIAEISDRFQEDEWTFRDERLPFLYYD